MRRSCAELLPRHRSCLKQSPSHLHRCSECCRCGSQNCVKYPTNTIHEEQNSLRSPLASGSQPLEAAPGFSEGCAGAALLLCLLPEPPPGPAAHEMTKNSKSWSSWHGASITSHTSHSSSSIPACCIHLLLSPFLRQTLQPLAEADIPSLCPKSSPPHA